MKILFAGGGTGGHFYPIVAVAEALNEIAEREHLVGIHLYFMSDSPIDKDLLFKNRISYMEIDTGKQRTYFSIMNFFDKFRTLAACIFATFRMFMLYPDVVFGKGGYASFPALFAAKLLRIPVVLHESDIIPGRVNKWASSYATKVAVSYPEAAKHFPHLDRVALTGQPVRKVLMQIPPEDPFELFKLEQGVPVILVLGGSSGSEKINEHLLDIMSHLVERYQVIHQTGEANIEWMKKRAGGVLSGNPNAGRYRPFPFLEGRNLAIAAKGSSLVISRAGSTIFEIAIWGIPSILIPLTIAHDDHQRENAYSYARTGAATVIDEANLKNQLFISVVDSILLNPEKQRQMAEGAKQFIKVDAAEKIARALLSIALGHD